MKHLSILNWVVFAVGEIILVLCFFMLFRSLPDNIFWLDLVIASIAYGLVYFRSLRPMIDLDDPAQREVSYLGFSWEVVIGYACTALAAMLLMQLFEVRFEYQLMVQIILAFFLLISFMVGGRMSAKTVEVFNQEQKLVSELERLRREMRRVDRTVAITSGIPDLVKHRVADLGGQLRYISPSNSVEARDLELEMIDKAMRINGLCSDYEANAESLMRALDEFQHIIQERKSIYSN